MCREEYWEEGSRETWQQEIGGAKDIAAAWANIPENVREILLLGTWNLDDCMFLSLACEMLTNVPPRRSWAPELPCCGWEATDSFPHCRFWGFVEKMVDCCKYSAACSIDFIVQFA